MEANSKGIIPGIEALIDQRVKEGIEELKMELEVTPKRRRYTKKEVAAYHSVTLKTIDNWCANKGIDLDRIEVGGRVYFDPHQVENLFTKKAR